uniref:Uncharacterized protein n=1 Tax=Solanum lycopersicum TaxID=4081 RepID=A0A494G9N1_SOLLC
MRCQPSLSMSLSAAARSIHGFQITAVREPVAVALLGVGFPVIQSLDVIEAIHTFDANVAHIADGEIAVQCLADADAVCTTVVAGQADVQLIVEAQGQGQIDLMRPARKTAFRVGQLELHLQAFTFGFNTAQLPIHRPDKPVGGGRFFADTHHLHALRVAFELAEPRPAHRHAGADALAGLEHGLVVQPDDRRLAVHLITEDVRALLGHQHFGLTVADAPAVQFIQFHGFNVGRVHGTTLDQQLGRLSTVKRPRGLTCAWRNRTGAAAAIDGNEHEHRFGHFTPLAGQRIVAPYLDHHLDRAAADFQGLGVKGQLRADSHRHQKRHAIDGDGRNTAAGNTTGHGSAGQVHLRHQPAAENIAEAVGFAGKRGDLQGQVALRDRIFLFELYHAGGASDP